MGEMCSGIFISSFLFLIGLRVLSPARCLRNPVEFMKITPCTSPQTRLGASGHGLCVLDFAPAALVMSPQSSPFPNSVTIGDVRGHSARSAISGHMMLLRKKKERDTYTSGSQGRPRPVGFMA